MLRHSQVSGGDGRLPADEKHHEVLLSATVLVPVLPPELALAVMLLQLWAPILSRVLCQSTGTDCGQGVPT